MSAVFRIGRFQVSRDNLIIQDNIICPLIMMPDRVISTLRSKYLVSPIHYEGLFRKEPLEIPEDGLREIICNAIVHITLAPSFRCGFGTTVLSCGTLARCLKALLLKP